VAGGRAQADAGAGAREPGAGAGGDAAGARDGWVRGAGSGLVGGAGLAGMGCGVAGFVFFLRWLLAADEKQTRSAEVQPASIIAVSSLIPRAAPSIPINASLNAVDAITASAQPSRSNGWGWLPGKQQRDGNADAVEVPVPKTAGGDGAIHLCELVACRLPPEKWWDSGGGSGGGGGGGRKGGGGRGASRQAAMASKL